MSAIKNYIIDLANELGKDIEDITNEDIHTSMYSRAQEIFANGPSSEEEIKNFINFLPTMNQELIPNSEIGHIYQDKNGTFFLIVA